MNLFTYQSLYGLLKNVQGQQLHLYTVFRPCSLEAIPRELVLDFLAENVTILSAALLLHEDFTILYEKTSSFCPTHSSFWKVSYTLAKKWVVYFLIWCVWSLLWIQH